MPGFPGLMKEVAEILECGPLNDQFRAIEYVNAIERFAQVEQRLGL